MIRWLRWALTYSCSSVNALWSRYMMIIRIRKRGRASNCFAAMLSMAPLCSVGAMMEAAAPTVTQMNRITSLPVSGRK